MAAIMLVIAGITCKPDRPLVEHPLDESKLSVLPAPEDIPPVALPGFRYSRVYVVESFDNICFRDAGGEIEEMVAFEGW